MAITKFQPEVWGAGILTNLRNELVYAGGNISNRDYEGDIAQAGDTVHIVSFADPAVRTYTKGGPITWDVLTDAELLLTIDQSDYFAFTVDDIDKRQSLPGFVQKATQGAAYNLVGKVDTYVSGLLLTAVNGSSNDIGPVSVTVSAADAYSKIFVAGRTKLNKANVPMDGRWAVVPPELSGYLLQDARFIANAQDNSSGGDLGAGHIGRIAGFQIFESNAVPVSGSAFHVIMGHSMALTFADAINEVEALRLQTEGFLDGIRGLHLYGAKVVRPTALALATVTLA